MRLRSLSFAGYRSFAARSPAAPGRPLEQMQLAPLTILLGKNNSGKSTAARFTHHLLLAIGSEGTDPFPMGVSPRSFGARFRDIQHGGNFFNPLDLEFTLDAEGGARMTFAAQLIELGELADDRPPVIQSCTIDGNQITNLAQVTRGLLPVVPDVERWREGARSLLEASCYLGPVRDPVRSSYLVKSESQVSQLPNSNDSVAQMLLSDVQLRTEVGAWMAGNLEGWRVDVKQNLDVFNLLARGAGREVNLADAGQGFQQVLPVVTLCCWRNLNRGSSPFLDIIEQPELHLHDASHAALGDLLLSAIADNRGDMVVETHSESLVLRVRRRIAEGLVSPDKVAILYVEDTGEGSRIRRIPMKDNGEAEWWPNGVFSESFVEVKAIRQAQRAREEG
jgi:hypothetical protein